jgi:tetratricopeptide (TPR) repeat protein
MDRLFRGELELRGIHHHPEAERWPNDRMLVVYANAHLDYGSALATAGRYEDAIEQFRLALAISPDNETARQNLGLAREALAAG